jgi:hypothetical protein
VTRVPFAPLLAAAGLLAATASGAPLALLSIGDSMTEEYSF